jgi:hypothetical protein
VRCRREWPLHDSGKPACESGFSGCHGPVNPGQRTGGPFLSRRVGVAGVYNLARYEGEMRETLTRWADYVGLVSEALPQSVGPLPGEAPRPKRLVRVEG